MRALVTRLEAAGPVALYDPFGLAAPLAELYPLDRVRFTAVYAQKIESLGRSVLGRTIEPVTALRTSGAKTVFVSAFDAERAVAQIRHLAPPGANVVTLDAARLPHRLITNTARYLDPLNFATNFAFFRDGDGQHTRLTTFNYWFGYGARGVRCSARLFDGTGNVLADWEEELPDAPAALVIDSAAVRARFGLTDFAGQLFIHFVGVKGHDVVKYVLDTYGDAPETLSGTHDANAWPAALYAGLPAPRTGEQVVLWVQNSLPCPIPPRSVGLNVMGDDAVSWLERGVPAFATCALDVTELLPGVRYPDQIEVQAGKYFVRPRYEIRAANGRTRLAHANVEREDLAPDPRLPELGSLIGRGFLLPAPLLPLDRYACEFLPTPMATDQSELPLAVALYDGSGKEILFRRLGNLKRRDSTWFDVDTLLGPESRLPSGYGHLCLLYDFSAGRRADGWLHAIFRYRDRGTGHLAETSFGAHIFNTVLTLGAEPQSYAGSPPGLSTRLYLRLGPAGCDTTCHLIYPASTPWHPLSSTDVTLFDAHGVALAHRRFEIPCNGSVLWSARGTFDDDLLSRAGLGSYVIVRDTTCRLFGYQGLVNDKAFSLDHMFGA